MFGFAPLGDAYTGADAPNGSPFIQLKKWSIGGALGIFDAGAVG